MAVRVAINGFGRIGRLAFRAAFERADIEVVHINDPAGDPEAAAHLLQFDSVHGIWRRQVEASQDALTIEGKGVTWSRHRELGETPWDELGVDVVMECSGLYRQSAKLQPLLDRGVKKVVVSAPVKDGTLNVVMGVNDHLYDGSQSIVTAASCTTNCLAPVVDVVHKCFGIHHGSLTTIHSVTGTQSILDSFHKDPRRARACGSSLIPTSTGSATAIAEIFPELRGQLNGLAVRVPLANASLTDCVFEVQRPVTVDEVNEALKAAAEGYLNNILGYETRPLVSVDYRSDTRSSIIDGLSTMVINGSQVKVLAWYDNEMGYSHRLVELTAKVAASL